MSNTMQLMLKREGNIHLVPLTIVGGSASPVQIRQIKQIVERQLAGQTISQVSEVRCNLADLSVQILGDTQAVPEGQASATCRISKLFATRGPRETFRDVRRRMEGALAGRIPIIKYLWYAVLQPIALLISRISPGLIPIHERATKDETLLVRTLESAKKQLFDPAREEDEEPLTLFEKALTFHKEWPQQQRAALDPLFSLRDLTPNKTLAIIPTGYWLDDETYCPILMTLFTDGDNQLCLSEQVVGADDGGIVREYKWENLPPEEQLKDTLHLLLQTSVRPQDQSMELKRLMQAFYAQQVSPRLRGAEQEVSAADKERVLSLTRLALEEDRVGRWRERLLFGTEAKINETPVFAKEGAHRRRKVQADPWEMIGENLRLHFPGINNSETTLFSLGLFYNELRQSIGKVESLPVAQRLKWIGRLQKQRDKLERKLKKQDVGQVSLRALIPEAKQMLDQLNEQIRWAEIQDKKEQVKRLKTLDSAPSHPHQVEIDPAKLGRVRKFIGAPAKRSSCHRGTGL